MDIREGRRAKSKRAPNDSHQGERRASSQTRVAGGLETVGRHGGHLGLPDVEARPGGALPFPLQQPFQFPGLMEGWRGGGPPVGALPQQLDQMQHQLAMQLAAFNPAGVSDPGALPQMSFPTGAWPVMPAMGFGCPPLEWGGGLQLQQAMPLPLPQQPAPKVLDQRAATVGEDAEAGIRGDAAVPLKPRKRGRPRTQQDEESATALASKMGRRLKQNREAARRWRQRKQAYVKQLEEQVASLKQENPMTEHVAQVDSQEMACPSKTGSEQDRGDVGDSGRGRDGRSGVRKQNTAQEYHSHSDPDSGSSSAGQAGTAARKLEEVTGSAERSKDEGWRQAGSYRRVTWKPGTVILPHSLVHWQEQQGKLATAIQENLLAGLHHPQLQNLVTTMLAQVMDVIQQRRALVQHGHLNEVVSGCMIKPGQVMMLWMGGLRPSDVLRRFLVLLPALNQPPSTELSARVHGVQERYTKVERELTLAFEDLCHHLASSIVSSSLQLPAAAGDKAAGAAAARPSDQAAPLGVAPSGAAAMKGSGAGGVGSNGDGNGSDGNGSNGNGSSDGNHHGSNCAGNGSSDGNHHGSNNGNGSGSCRDGNGNGSSAQSKEGHNTLDLPSSTRGPAAAATAPVAGAGGGTAAGQLRAAVPQAAQLGGAAAGVRSAAAPMAASPGQPAGAVPEEEGGSISNGNGNGGNACTASSKFASNEHVGSNGNGSGGVQDRPGCGALSQYHQVEVQVGSATGKGSVGAENGNSNGKGSCEAGKATMGNGQEYGASSRMVKAQSLMPSAMPTSSMPEGAIETGGFGLPTDPKDGLPDPAVTGDGRLAAVQGLARVMLSADDLRSRLLKEMKAQLSLPHLAVLLISPISMLLQAEALVEAIQSSTAAPSLAGHHCS